MKSARPALPAKPSHRRGSPVRPSRRHCPEFSERQLFQLGRMEKMIEFFLSLQVWGTPERRYERIVDIQERTGAEAFNGVFSYAGMPYDLAEANLRLFATEVMPESQETGPA